MSNRMLRLGKKEASQMSGCLCKEFELSCFGVIHISFEKASPQTFAFVQNTAI